MVRNIVWWKRIPFRVKIYFVAAVATIHISGAAHQNNVFRMRHVSKKKPARYQQIGSVDWSDNDLRDALVEFAKIYEGRPIRENIGGMRSGHMFCVWFLVKRLQPKYIIESGIHRGQSTWLFEQAAPYAQIISIDPVLGKRAYISKKVRYTTKDFSLVDWSGIDKEHTLCFFDDHQGVKRVKQCYERGFKHILYEDNYASPGGNYDPRALSVKATLLAGNADAHLLRRCCKTYYEFPPIVPLRDGGGYPLIRYAHVTHSPLLKKLVDPYQKVFWDDASYYRWIAYLELK